MITTTVRYFAAAAAAADTEEERVDLPAGSSVADLVAECGRRHGASMQAVLERSSYLLDAVAVRDRTKALDDRQTVDVLPPFAGG